MVVAPQNMVAVSCMPASGQRHMVSASSSSEHGAMSSGSSIGTDGGGFAAALGLVRLGRGGTVNCLAWPRCNMPSAQSRCALADTALRVLCSRLAICAEDALDHRSTRAVVSSSVQLNGSLATVSR